jgi:hypothetical protein
MFLSDEDRFQGKMNTYRSSFFRLRLWLFPVAEKEERFHAITCELNPLKISVFAQGPGPPIINS